MGCLPGLNVYSLLAVDLLHEVELGVWKALFIHILRILFSYSPAALSELDRRYPLSTHWQAPYAPDIYVITGFALSPDLARIPFAGLQAMHCK